MPINENMVQEIVQEVMAKMQIADAPTGKHGIFKEMNDAIEAAKKSQLIVKKMSMDQREKIITCSYYNNCMVRRQRINPYRDGTFWCDRCDHSMYQPK